MIKYDVSVEGSEAAARRVARGLARAADIALFVEKSRRPIVLADARGEMNCHRVGDIPRSYPR